MRVNGLHATHLTVWKKEVQGALKRVNIPIPKHELQKVRKQRKSLEKELKRKAKALAEVKTLLDLKKTGDIVFQRGCMTEMKTIRNLKKLLALITSRMKKNLKERVKKATTFLKKQ